MSEQQITVEQMISALKSAQKAIAECLPHMATDDNGIGPDCTALFQAQVDICFALSGAEVLKNEIY